MKKPLFVFLGSLSLALGIIGIVVPGLPTTSFVLLAAYLYARSSEKLYSKLLNHKFLGGYIRDFQKGVSIRTKIKAISMMWVMITISGVFFIENLYVRIVLFVVGLIGTIVMSRLRGPKDEASATEN
ncbi:MAG: YbaN family protein [Bacteroidales bacterium]|jgi:uncharacterized membrane protein YbaN (DUF454 family)|nr:YbaN family protein [Bacteroidales bacterium]